MLTGIIGLILLLGFIQPSLGEEQQPEEKLTPAQQEWIRQFRKGFRGPGIVSHSPASPTIRSFPTAIKKLPELYRGHQKTFLCGCSFTSTGRLKTSCNYPAKKIVWKHVISPARMGKSKPCWNRPLCLSVWSKKPFGGRFCCRRSDSHFAQMEGDLVNLVPMITDLSKRRGIRDWGVVANISPRNGCPVYFDQAGKTVQPPPSVRGDIARVHLYYQTTYGLPLSPHESQLFQRWDRLDPVDSWELERNRRIIQIQGVGNPLVGFQ